MRGPVAAPAWAWLVRWARGHARLCAGLALTALVARACWVRWQLLDSSPFPLGVDGYFYPIQLRALLETGELAYPASPLAFWLMAPLAALTDPIFGAKLGAMLAGGLTPWPAYALGRRLGGGRVAGLAAATVAASSVGALMLTAEFVKNSFGVTFALAALAALLAALAEPSRRRSAVAVLAAVACVLAHKSAAALLLLGGGAALVSWAWQRGGAWRRRGVGALALATGGLLAVGTLAPELGFSPELVWRERGLLFGAWHWELPALAVRGYRLSLGYEVVSSAVACALAAVALLWQRRALAPPGRRAAAWALVALGLVLGWPALAVEDAQGLGFRLRLIAFVPWAAAAAVVTGAVLAVPTRRAALRGGLAALAALVLWRAPTRLERGVVYAHPAMIAAVCALASAVPPGELVLVSERHIAFQATWYARVATSVRPRKPPRHRWRLLPLAFIGEGTPLARALAAARAQPGLLPPRGLHPSHRDGLVLIAEPTWQWISARLPPAARAHYEAWRAL